jgi:hypothetical protein
VPVSGQFIKEPQMFGSTVLEVVIGLVFLYLSLSLICSALNEYYSALLWRRSTHLRDSLFSIFNKDDPKGLAFLLEFYTHPLISGLNPTKRVVATAPNTNRALAQGLPWHQKTVVSVARFVADLVAKVAGWAGSLAGGLWWVARAFRDPYGVGGVLDDMRKELMIAARATPNYIPDRSFSGALFAVLASDAGASRRLQVQLDVQLNELGKLAPRLGEAFKSCLQHESHSLKETVAAAKAPEEITAAVTVAFANLLASIPDVPANQSARQHVEAAKDAVIAAGPRTPPPEQVRDHVWTTLQVSLQRLEAEFATLTAGSLQAALSEEVKRALTAIGPAKLEPPRSVEQARAMGTRMFASLRAVLDGQRGDAQWSRASSWVDHEVVALAASEDDLITIAKLRDAVEALPQSEIRSALLSLMDEVGDDLSHVKHNIQVWYNDSMERVSGWYKRNTQIILSIIALVIAVSLNADTIVVAERLWTDSTLRANVNAMAQSVDPKTLDAKPSADWNKATDQMLEKTGLPLGWSLEELEALGFEGEAMHAFRSGRLPGWSALTKTGGVVGGKLFGTPRGLYKILGLALTAIAVSMGAPFWFDMLNKLVNVRTSGLQPKKTGDKPPEPASTK